MIILGYLCGSSSLSFFFVLCAINGWAMGSLDTGGNVLCLDIWRGESDSGPYMHSIHFSYAFGSFLAPVVGENFLGVNKSNPNYTENQTIAHMNNTPFMDENNMTKSENHDKT